MSASQSGVNPACFTTRAAPDFSSSAALAAWSWSSACGNGHEDRRPADHGELRDGRSAGPGDDEMRLRDAHRQIGEERLHLGHEAHRIVGLAHARLVLAARLLDDDETGALERLEQRDRRRHDVRHHACALRAAGDEQAQLAAEGGVGLLRRDEDGRAYRVADQLRLGGDLGLAMTRLSKPLATACTRPARNRFARPITAFCSCRIVGTLSCVPASTGGTVG